MPPKPGKSKKGISKNISTEMKRHPEMPQNRAVAIAMAKAIDGKKMTRSKHG